MNKPLINWDELDKMLRQAYQPPNANKMPPGGPGSGIGGWDRQAKFYNKMAKMETQGTLNQINCFDCEPEDTFLDVGCGPGRITVPMAKRAKRVTALDASPKMLEFCAENAKAQGLTNVKTVLADWEDEETLKSLEKHDIVLASRSVGMRDIKKLSMLAKKYVVLVIWSHGCPSIPNIVGSIFEGTEKESATPMPPHRMPLMMDRRLGNNLLYNKIYDMGYNPNLKIVEDGFTKDYSTKQEAYDDLKDLRENFDEGKMDRFKSNVDQYLTQKNDGTITFLAKTKTVVYWWKPEIETK